MDNTNSSFRKYFIFEIDKRICLKYSLSISVFRKYGNAFWNLFTFLSINLDDSFEHGYIGAISGKIRGFRLSKQSSQLALEFSICLTPEMCFSNVLICCYCHTLAPVIWPNVQSDLYALAVLF